MVKGFLSWLWDLLQWLVSVFRKNDVAEEQVNSVVDAANEEDSVVSEHDEIDASNSGVVETEDGGLNFDEVRRPK